jgi:GSH-dependent disulfide-bond oxidoreductase
MTSNNNSFELELYGARTGNCRRAAISLEEAGLAYRVRPVDLSDGAQRSPAHLALNPAGKVPVLVARSTTGEPDFVLTQSNAIAFYAEERAPGRLLPPAGSFARARALEAFFYFTTDVIALNGAAFFLGSQKLQQAADQLTERYLGALRDCERFVSEAGFMGGDRFSIADIAAYTIITAVRSQLPWDRSTRLAAWLERIGERPAVQRGMTAFGG